MADHEPAPRKFTLKPKEFERVNAPPEAQAPSADHDVYAIRQELRAREQAAGLDTLAPKPKVTPRRRRDFVLLAGGIAAVGGTVAATSGGNLIVIVSALAGVVISVVALAWVVFGIMGRY